MSSKPMTNYNKELDEILLMYKASLVYEYVEPRHEHLGSIDFDEAKQALTSLIKELVAEAKPEPTKYEKYNSDCLEGFNIATDEFEQNLLKALEEV